MEFKEFEPRFNSAKTRVKLSAGLNLKTFDTILSGSRSNPLNSATGQIKENHFQELLTMLITTQTFN